jgi:hypothetical protein
MHLYGYDQRPVPVYGDVDWTSAERMAADFGVELAVAQRAVEHERAFTRPSVSSLVVDGTPLLEEPAFWAAHLGGVSHQEEQVAAAFGVTWDEARETGLPLLRRPDEWPVLSLPLPAGGVMVVIHRTDRIMTLGEGCVWVPDRNESRVDFWLAPPVGAGLELASVSGHQWGPGLRWPELRGIARAAAPDRLAVARRLLLLAPILGDVDAGEEAVAWFAQALSLIGGRDRRSFEARSAAEALVHSNDCFAPAKWWCDDHVWMCDGVVSVRNPAGHGPLPPEDLRRASEAVQPDV